VTADALVDVVIAVHDAERPVDRAVRSILDEGSRVRVTVVCHGIPAESVESRLPEVGSRVRIVEFADGVASPAGPFNHGLLLSTAEYVMIMGSDDYLESGAIRTWLAAARSSGADIQLAPLRYQGGALLANPLVRPWRRRRLDPVRDRLFYRTAPLGLIRRDLVGDTGPLTEGMPVGEDIAWSSALWTSGRRIDFDARMPAYVIGADAAQRVTMSPRPVETVLAPVDALVASPWAQAQPADVRSSLVAKLLRVNLLGALRSRPDAASWPDSARIAVSATLRTLADFAPQGSDDLPRGDRALLDAAATATTAQHIEAAIAQYRQVSRAQRVVPRRLTRTLGREAVLRRYARYAIGRIGA
jgi:hypothetical protein